LGAVGETGGSAEVESPVSKVDAITVDVNEVDV
jgi:hypothetical protein